MLSDARLLDFAGQFLLEESRLTEAAEMAKKAAELDNTEFDVVFNAAHMLRQASLNEAAEKYYDLAARLRPNYPAALMNLGAILHLNGRLQKAEANYLRALQLKPDDVITQSNLRKLWNIMEKQGLKTSKTWHTRTPLLLRLSAGFINRQNFPGVLW